ncbi:MAG: RNA polymerase-binding protein RbpA [Sporichthyaceae bacterium]
MSERALRGSRLGATSYENDRDIELAPRTVVGYDCPKGHHLEVPFSAEAEEVPVVWECRVCGSLAIRSDGESRDEKQVKPARTHWDMLMERRTREELEEILAERLAVLRAGGIKGHPATSKKSA